MSVFADFFTPPGMHAATLQEAERQAFEDARERILDELEIATVDAAGKRFKERDIVQAMKTVMRLP